MRDAALVCDACGSTRVRRSKRQSLSELPKMVLGVYPFRCSDCQARFWAGVWLLSKLQFAKCPKCLSLELVTWPEKHFAPSFWRHVARMFGARYYRCTPCRCKFLSFRPRRPLVTGVDAGTAEFAPDHRV